MSVNTVRTDGDRHAEVIQAEVAMELINRARGLVYERIYKLESGTADELQAAKALDPIAIKLYQLLRGIDYRQSRRVAVLIERWSFLLRDEQLFWTAIDEDPGLFTI